MTSRGRSLRLRITAVAVATLTVGLAVGATALVLLFGYGRVDRLDARLDAESAQLRALVGSGQLPSPLPTAPAVLAQVVDPAGTVLAASPSASRVVPLLVDTPDLGRRTTSDTTLGGESVRVSVTTARLDDVAVTVVVALPLTDVDEAVAALRRIMLLMVPVVVGAAGLATWLAVGSALQPVDELRAAADRVVDVRRPPPPLPVAGTGDELARLAATLDRMLGRLHAADEQQRAFLADAAHELRSPLASILTQLEVASTDPAYAASAEVFDDVLVDVQRLRRLVDDLLLLARLDAVVDDDVRGARPELFDLARYADGAAVARGPVLVRADSAALDRAVANLVANARRHARQRVGVGVTVDGDEAVVVVEDDGEGIAPEDRDRIFERWTRLDAARSRDSGGSGLGLAIVRTVARVHGGRVTVGDSPLGGARFELRLPLAPDPGTGPSG